VYLITTLVVIGSGCHHVEEFREFDLSTAVLVEFGDHLIDCLSLGFNAEGIYGHLEFSWVNGSCQISVEEIETLLDGLQSKRLREPLHHS